MKLKKFWYFRASDESLRAESEIEYVLHAFVVHNNVIKGYLCFASAAKTSSTVGLFPSSVSLNASVARSLLKAHTYVVTTN